MSQRKPISPHLFLLLILLGIGACSTPGKAVQSVPELQSPTPVVTLPASPEATTPVAVPTHTATPISTQTPELPKFTATPATPATLACWKAGGWIEVGSLHNSLLPLPLDVRVYLPPCYHQEPERRYPALYLIHGQYYTDDQWDRLGADEMADRLIGNGEIPPLIIVMPRDRIWRQPANDNFGQAVVEVLVPWVDQTYRTLPERESRAIGGLSRGAAWAVHLGISHWELFGAIGAHSLPVFWSDTPRLRTWLDRIPPGSQPRIFLDVGEKDRTIRSTQWFESLLDEKGIAHDWYLFPGYHEEAYWESHVEQYLRWYAQDW